MTSSVENDHPFANIIIGYDHDGFLMKETIVRLFRRPFAIRDVGVECASDMSDYPDYAHKVVTAISAGHGDLGILMCGSKHPMRGVLEQ